MRLALLPIGAYAPRWLMQYQHVDPEEAVKAHQDLSAAHSVGIHWGTFELSAEGPDEPPQALAAAREKAELDTQSFVVLTHGQPRDFLPVQHGIQTRCTLEPPEET